VLEAAKTPNPTLEKMMEAERQFVRKPSSPSKKDLSPRKQPKEKAAASPPAHGSPFFRRKDTPALGGASPRDKERSRAVFGFPLERAMELQRDTHRELSVPFVVHNLCSQVLLLGGHRSEGIFRISINSDDLDTYSKNIDRGDYKLPPKDPNYPAVLLKHYLRNLPEVTLLVFFLISFSLLLQPLCPEYGRCLAAAGSDLLVADVFASLSGITQNLIKYLANFICLLGDPKFVTQTKMTVEGLCIVFTPATIKNPVFDCEIANCLYSFFFLFLELDASALRNQSAEQAFMQRLVLWVRAAFPDNSVAGFSTMFGTTAPVAVVVAPMPTGTPPPRPPRRATPRASSPPQLKKRVSTLTDEQSAPQDSSSPGKSRKTGKNVSPSTTMTRMVAPPRDN
jgi:hypothetical protein